MRYELTDIGLFGTSLKGHITATFDELVATFGYPNISNDKTPQADKVWWEWCIDFYDEEEDEYHISTIYDWKEMGPSSSQTGEYRWHVGGKSLQSLWCVMDTLEQAYPEKLHL